MEKIILKIDLVKNLDADLEYISQKLNIDKIDWLRVKIAELVAMEKSKILQYSAEFHVEPVVFKSEQFELGNQLLEVPISKDGSYFNLDCATKSGIYTIGEKGSEIKISSFTKALEMLRDMQVPRWRRPSKTSGRPGIVKGISWEKKEINLI